MFWKKPARKIKPRPKPTMGDPNSPVKPSPRREKNREKRIDLQLNCFVLVIDTEQVVQCKTINVSKTGMLLKSIHALANGQDVICVFSNKKTMSRPSIQCTNPHLNWMPRIASGTGPGAMAISTRRRSKEIY